MRIFFSGIGGVGIGPLAQVALQAGYDIVGSDLSDSRMTESLASSGVRMSIGLQTGEFLQSEHAKSPVSYYVYTAALPADAPEMLVAKQLGIPCLKRDGLLSRIIDEKGLDLIAVAGTHGKTTTSGMFAWVMQQLGLPLSYLVGTTMPFGPSGKFDSDSRYIVYECDEYDRNFLHYTPKLSVITAIDYDHPDTFPTRESYQQAFTAFIDQSDKSLLWQKDYNALGTHEITSDYTLFDESMLLDHIKLPGLHVRQNAFLVERAMMQLFPDTQYHDIVSAINSFPGTDRRMEKLGDNLYTDYGHHPAEIKATLQLAREMSDYVVLVYQPHQNTRQHEVRGDYTDQTFVDASEIYWLPTYLSRENANLDVLTPQQLSSDINDRQKVHVADLNDELWTHIQRHREAGHLVLIMGAGNVDGWARSLI